MNIQLHKNARTTPAIRREIQQAPKSISSNELARRLGLNRITVRKWRKRTTTDDGSHRPHRLQTQLTPAQELLVVEIRKLFLLSLDDLLVATHEFINDKVSRSGLDRCLRRHGVSNLKALIQAQQEPLEENQPKPKTFKDYEPGFVHVDVKYLPKMPDEPKRRYLFAAIDRATRWVYVELLEDKSAQNAQGFLKRMIEAAPMKIQNVLTDNGKEFTDRFIATGERKPTGNHPFDKLCAEMNIEHRLIKPKRPQTNGMVERFNGRISELLATTRFDGALELADTMLNYARLYNHYIPQKALGHKSPIDAMKHWSKTHPHLFKKKVYKQTGLDI